MVERFYETVIFLLIKALLPLRSEKARPLPLKKKKSQLSERHIHKHLANTALAFLHDTRPPKRCSDENRELTGCISSK